MCNKYPECDSCYFNNREPAICDDCEDGDQYEPEDADDEAFDVLRRISFHPKDPEWDTELLEEAA